MGAERKDFYKPEEIFKDVEKKVKDARKNKEPIDYLTFVPDGEPTLDVNLGKEIELLKTLGIKIAVISNASLIGREDVRDDLCRADWVSVKIDAISEDIWRRVNRPHKFLRLDKIFQGILEFSRIFRGELATETMLIQDVNDDIEEIRKVASFNAKIRNVKSYISIPTRPPAEKWVKAANEHTINYAYQLFQEKSISTEYLIGYEGNAFAFTGNVEEDLLSITSVHPMREEAVDEFLKKANKKRVIIEKLISEDKLAEVKYKGKRFFIRKLQ